jgi:dephospho-CoA kinase
VVARHAFATPEDRAWLEQLLWPRVGRRVAEWRQTADGVALVVETPLLFEAGLEGNYDATIAIVADEKVRNERAAARGHASLDERTARQLSQDEKARRATYAVENSGTLEQLEQELSEVLAKLTR